MRTISSSLIVLALMLMPALPLTGQAKVEASSHVITRADILDVAKEIHPPGCTDSMTGDYCTLSTAYETRNEIYELLKQGMDKDEVLDFLVDKYGERILASPVKSGFHLTAWLLPGFALLGGGGIIVFLVRRWARKNTTEAVDHHNEETKTAMSSEAQQRVQAELKNWL
jgi:cytochrome c-type biogenesis protein CcmH